MTKQVEIDLPAFKPGFHLITRIIEEKVSEHLPEVGIINLFIRHTSAAITINENADPSVRYDLQTYINRLVPESRTAYTHTDEGDDDMPAHIKASIIGASITVPIEQHRMRLGTWQGIYLCEFRRFAGSRRITATIIY